MLYAVFNSVSFEISKDPQLFLRNYFTSVTQIRIVKCGAFNKKNVLSDE